MSASASRATIAARLDDLPSAAVWRLVVLLSLGGFFEFYDLLMTAYVSPGLVAAGVFHAGARGLFGLTDQATFAAATFLGLFVGTLLFAGVADRFGRRVIFTASLLWYTGAAVAMACQHTAAGVDLWRFVSGLGIGVELVTIDAYLIEITPPRLRGRAFAINQSIQFSAVPIVAFACWVLVPRRPFGIAGWRWVVLAGASAALAVWVIRRRLPESPRWLAEHDQADTADAIITRLDPRGDRPVAPSIAAVPEPSPERGRFSELFRPPYRRRTIMLSVFNASQAIGFYGFGNWVPSLMAAQGQGVLKSLEYSFIIAAAYPIGPLLCSTFADRFERKHQIMLAAMGTAGCGLLFAHAASAWALVTLGVAITLSNNLLSYAFHAYQSELFPTRVRALAVGFVYSWSRLSTAASSLVIGALLGVVGATGVFVFIALAMVVVMVAVGAFGPPTSGQTLETLSR